MYSLVRYYIKTSILFLIVGLLLGGYLILIREVRGSYPHSQLVTAHSHLILIGFVMMMIMGVALWMFPRPSKEDKHYRPDVAYLIYWLMLISVSARFLAEVLSTWLESSILHWVIALSSLLQIVGMLVFFYNIWTRIRPIGSHLREAKGEKF